MRIVATSSLPPVLYHGTTTALEPSVRRDGLRNPFLTDDRNRAAYYAQEAVAERGGRPVVLEIHTDSLDPSKLRYDGAAMDEPVMASEEDRDEAWNEAGRLHPEWIDPEDRDIIVVPPTAWQVSLEGVGSVWYDGTILVTSDMTRTKTASSDQHPFDAMKLALEARGFRFVPPDAPEAFVSGGYRNPTFIDSNGITVAFSTSPVYVHKGVVKRAYPPVMPEPELTLEAIYTPDELRGRGLASEALRKVTGAADEAGIMLMLEPTVIKPLSGKKPLKQRQLVDWYKRHGWSGKEGDFDMVLERKPQSALSVGKEVVATSSLPEMPPEGQVYAVYWAEHMGVQYFDNLTAAKAWAKTKPNDAEEPKLVDKPKGTRVRHKASEGKTYWKAHVSAEFQRDPTLAKDNGVAAGAHVFLDFDEMVARIGRTAYWVAPVILTDDEVEPAGKNIFLSKVTRLSHEDFAPVDHWTSKTAAFDVDIKANQKTASSDVPAVTDRLDVVILGRKVGSVVSFQEASEKLAKWRSDNGLAGSDWPPVLLVDSSGQVVAHVSYNCKVWAGKDYVADAKPLYDPYAHDPQGKPMHFAKESAFDIVVKSAKSTAPIPENYDTVEKGDDGGVKWRLCAGGGDWEDAWSLMAFEIGDPAKKRVWAELGYDRLDGFKNDGECSDKELCAKAKQMGKDAVQKWLAEARKIFNEKQKATYDYCWSEACWSALESDDIKDMVTDKGIDVLEWKAKKTAAADYYSNEPKRRAVADAIQQEAIALRRFDVGAGRNESDWTGRDYMVESVISWCDLFAKGPQKVQLIPAILPGGKIKHIPDRMQTPEEWKRRLMRGPYYGHPMATPEDARMELDRIREIDAEDQGVKTASFVGDLSARELAGARERGVKTLQELHDWCIDDRSHGDDIGAWASGEVWPSFMDRANASDDATLLEYLVAANSLAQPEHEKDDLTEAAFDVVVKTASIEADEAPTSTEERSKFGRGMCHALTAALMKLAPAGEAVLLSERERPEDYFHSAFRIPHTDTYVDVDRSYAGRDALAKAFGSDVIVTTADEGKMMSLVQGNKARALAMARRLAARILGWSDGVVKPTMYAVASDGPAIITAAAKAIVPKFIDETRFIHMSANARNLVRRGWDPSREGTVGGSLYKGISVTLPDYVDSWIQIARLGGTTAVWVDLPPGKRMLDFYATFRTRDASKNKVLKEWAIQQGRWQVQTRVQYAHYDEDGEIEGWMDADPDEEFENPPDGEPHDDEYPQTRKYTGFSDDDNEAIFQAYIEQMIPEACGVWYWDEDDPAGLSAPQGVIPSKLAGQLKFSAIGKNEMLASFDVDIVKEARVIPVEKARELATPVELPDDEDFRGAVGGTEGAKITDDGLEIDLERRQHPDQGGRTSVRSGVFYQPFGSPSKYPFTGRNNYGGSDKIRGTTLLRKPIFIKGSVGGKVPERAYESVLGKGSYAKLEAGLRQVSMMGGLWRGHSQADIIEASYALLEEFGGDPEMVYEIMDVTAKQGGNGLRMALQENIIAHVVRNAGYDSIVGWTKRRDGTPFITEVFDLREVTYPTRWEGGDIHEKFVKDDGKVASADFDVMVKEASGQTETPAFKAWFGASKVVGPDGKPLRVFHGTNRVFTEFRAPNWFGPSRPRTTGTKGMGTRSMFYFTPDPEIAHGYADIGEAPPKNMNIIPAYLSLQNPIEIDAKGGIWRAVQDELRQAYDSKAYDGAIISNVIDLPLGVEERTSTVFVAFRPDQIKSAIGNRGTFDPKVHDITAATKTAQEQREFDFGIDVTNPRPLRKEDLEALRSELATAANEVLAGWEQDADGIDMTYGSGGVCDAIAQAMSGVLAGHGYDVTDGGQDGDDHAWVIAYDGSKAFSVDIPPSVYETGSGYAWRKKEGANVTPENIEIMELDADIARMLKTASLPTGYSIVAPSDGAFDIDDGEAFAKGLDDLEKNGGINVLRNKELDLVVVDGSGTPKAALYTSSQGGEFSFDVIVAPDVQGQGIGSHLIDAAVSEGRQLAADGLNFRVDVVNPKLVEPLKRRGFEITEETGGHVLMQMRTAGTLDPKEGRYAPKDDRYIYHNCWAKDLPAIASEGMTSGSFSDRPIDFGRDAWVAVRRKDFPGVIEQHQYGKAIAYEPAYNGATISPSAIMLSTRRGRIVGPLTDGLPKTAAGTALEFGNSKVVDDNGKPLVVYHGSKSPMIESFDPDKIGSNIGRGVFGTPNEDYGAFFFTSDPENAAWFADYREIPRQLQTDLVGTYGGGDEWYYDASDEEGNSVLNGGPFATPEEAEAEGKSHVKRYNAASEAGEDMFVRGYHLNIENPLEVSCEDMVENRWSPPMLVPLAKDAGHDGIIIRNFTDGAYVSDIYVIFDGAQAKPAGGVPKMASASNEQIRVFRVGASRAIWPGCLVTDSLAYADQHGQDGERRLNVYSETVRSDELVSLGDDHEFLYMPKSTRQARTATNSKAARLNLETGVDDTPAKGHLDTQLFESCKGTKFDRDVVGKHRRRKKQHRTAFAQEDRDLDGELIAELNAEYAAKWIPVESSAIREVAYFEPTGRMEFKMRDYREYSFHAVSKAEFDSFMASKSKGKWFADFVSRRRGQRTAERSPRFDLDTFHDEKPSISEGEFAEQLSWLLEPPNGPQASKMTCGERIVSRPEDGGLAEPPIMTVRGLHGSTRYLWIEDGQPVGGIQVVRRGREAAIANVYVSPEWRRHGIATKLVQFVKSKVPRVRLAPFFSGSGAGLMGFRAASLVSAKKTSLDERDQDIVDAVMKFWDSPDVEDKIEQAKHGDGLNKVEIGKFGDVTIFLVNGSHVKREMYMDFVEGGNDAVYGEKNGEVERFMPANEVWIDAQLDVESVPYVAVHELHEWCRMRAEGDKYEEAHASANELEYSLRNERVFEKVRAVIRFPRIRQPGPGTCAQACICMVLQYYNEETGIEGISEEASEADNKEGLPPETIKRILEDHGAKAEIVEDMSFDDVKECIDDGVPVIIEIQAWPKDENRDTAKSDKDGHYVVAIGHTSNYVIFADPSTFHRTYLAWDEMGGRWHDVDGDKRHERLGIIVTKPNAGEFDAEQAVKLGGVVTARKSGFPGLTSRDLVEFIEGFLGYHRLPEKGDRHHKWYRPDRPKHVEMSFNEGQKVDPGDVGLRGVLSKQLDGWTMPLFRYYWANRKIWLRRSKEVGPVQAEAEIKQNFAASRGNAVEEPEEQPEAAPQPAEKFDLNVIDKNRLNIIMSKVPKLMEQFHEFTDGGFDSEDVYQMVYETVISDPQLLLMYQSPGSVNPDPVKTAQAGGMVKTAATSWGAAGSGVLYYCGEDGTVLLLKRSAEVYDPGTWGIPGGAVKGTEGHLEDADREGVEFDEDTLRNSAHKEVEEEMGHLPEGKPVQSVTLEFGNFKYTTFRVDVTMEQKKAIDNNISLNWESDDHGWFPVTRLPQNVHPGVRMAVVRMFGGGLP